MIAMEIASDPSIRRFVRSIYEDDALISIVPTDRGRTEIGENHPFYVWRLPYSLIHSHIILLFLAIQVSPG